MNRIIKFRIWSKKGFWIKKDSFTFVQGKLSDGNDYFAPLVFSPETVIVQQFTGEKDVNGVEIYEGDVMASRGNYITEELDENGNYPDLKNVVVWNTKATRFGLIPVKEYHQYKDRDSDYIWTCYIRTFKEVIGNIFDNPNYLI